MRNHGGGLGGADELHSHAAPTPSGLCGRHDSILHCADEVGVVHRSQSGPPLHVAKMLLNRLCPNRSLLFAPHGRCPAALPLVLFSLARFSDPPTQHYRRQYHERSGPPKAIGGLISYPDNLTFSNSLYFLAAPTLCYELNFPRCALPLPPIPSPSAPQATAAWVSWVEEAGGRACWCGTTARVCARI